MGAPQPQNCYGDSGGPGFASVGGVRRVIGVVSRSFDSGPDCDAGGVDTRVDAYLSWIHAHLPAGTEVPCDSGLAEACPAPEPEPDPDDPMAEEDGGCCSTGDNGASSALLALALCALVLRRRR
jgi:MYXO-CTERM domain-containing protein